MNIEHLPGLPSSFYPESAIDPLGREYDLTASLTFSGVRAIICRIYLLDLSQSWGRLLLLLLLVVDELWKVPCCCILEPCGRLSTRPCPKLAECDSYNLRPGLLWFSQLSKKNLEAKKHAVYQSWVTLHA